MLYQVRRKLNIGMQEWQRLPWYEQHTLLEGLLEERALEVAAIAQSADDIHEDETVLAIAELLQQRVTDPGTEQVDELDELRGLGMKVRTV